MASSSSELIRKHIHNQFEKGYDFTSKLNRKIDRTAIIESLGLDIEKGYDIYNHQFKKILNQRKLNAVDYLETRFRRPQFSDINAIIKPEPQELFVEENPIEKIKSEISIEENTNVQNNSTGIQKELINEHIDVESIQGVLEAFWLLLKIKWPDIDQLTKEEKQSLSQMWLPVFRKYLTENWIYFGLPLISTIGIFTKHIKEAREKKQEETKRNEVFE
jgi:hypothetical protein